MGSRVNTLELDNLTADPSSPADGESWYRSDLGKFKSRENGVTKDTIGGGGSEQPAVQARRTTAYVTTASFVNVTLNATDVENDVSAVEHDDTNTDRLNLKVDTGLYRIQYHGKCSEPSGSASNMNIEAQVLSKDAGGALPGSEDITTVFDDSSIAGDFHDDSISGSFLYEAVASDYVTLQIRHIDLGASGDDVSVTDITFTAVRMTGEKGDAGDTGAPGAGVILQTKFVEVTTDELESSLIFVDLLSTTITTGANFLIVLVTAGISASSANKNAQMQIDIDGTTFRAAGEELKTSGVASSVAVSVKIAVTAALHTVKLQWRTSGGDVQCRAVISGDDEHCSMLLMESTS